jgi:hypothetical protein
MESFRQEINGKFNRKLSESKLAESTKQSYLSRMNVLANAFESRGIFFRQSIGLNDVKCIFDDLKEIGYSKNRIFALITAYRKFDMYYTKSNMRISNYIRSDFKGIYKHEVIKDADIGRTQANNIKNNLPPLKYMPDLYKDRLTENVIIQKATTQSDRDFKQSYHFLSATGLRSGAFFGVKSVGSDEYKGIMKEQVYFNANGSVTIKDIKDKYDRDGWTMELPAGHPGIRPLQKLMEASGKKLSILDQQTFERRFRKINLEVRRDPDIVEKYGNLPLYTPHSLRANFIHDSVQTFVSKGVSKEEAYEKVSKLVNHNESSTTRSYDI